MTEVQRAIHHAVRAGACRAAAKIQTDCAAVWVQVADAESRRSRVALAQAMRAVGAARIA